MNWELLSFIKRSNQRKKILKSLSSPKTPTEMANEISVSVSHISRTLKEFEERNIVECKTPKQKLGRIYALTKEGKEILEELESK